MSNTSPLQAEALGLKPSTAHTGAAIVAATNPVASKPMASKPAATKPAAKPVTKSTIPSKPILAKPNLATKVVAKPKAKDVKKSVKKNDKKDTKKVKPEKIKMERDSFTMPKDEYAQLSLLKSRLTALGQPAKKSELLRAGIKLLVAMSDNTLKTTLAKVPVIKTGRPNK